MQSMIITQRSGTNSGHPNFDNPSLFIEGRRSEKVTGNNRAHTRMKIAIKVQVTHPKTGAMQLITRDMSDGGLFLEADVKKLKVGSIVEVQVLGSMGDGNAAPVVMMQVRRVCCDGYGLQFIDMIA